VTSPHAQETTRKPGTNVAGGSCFRGGGGQLQTRKQRGLKPVTGPSKQNMGKKGKIRQSGFKISSKNLAKLCPRGSNELGPKKQRIR